MEIKVGDYVRTKDGRIGQYIKPDLGRPYITNRIEFYEINEGKYSPNITDLIEVGDYVNGHLVCDSSDGHIIMAFTDDLNEMNSIKDEFKEQDLVVFKVYKLNDINIKSIVTKENFESMEYKL